MLVTTEKAVSTAIPVLGFEVCGAAAASWCKRAASEVDTTRALLGKGNV